MSLSSFAIQVSRTVAKAPPSLHGARWYKTHRSPNTRSLPFLYLQCLHSILCITIPVPVLLYCSTIHHIINCIVTEPHDSSSLLFYKQYLNIAITTRNGAVRGKVNTGSQPRQKGTRTEKPRRKTWTKKKDEKIMLLRHQAIIEKEKLR